MDENRRNSYVNVTRWFTTIMNQDEVIRVLGQTTLCVKPAQFDGLLIELYSLFKYNFSVLISTSSEKNVLIFVHFSDNNCLLDLRSRVDLQTSRQSSSFLPHVYVVTTLLWILLTPEAIRMEKYHF